MQEIHRTAPQRRRLAEPKAEHPLDGDERPIGDWHSLDDVVDVLPLEEVGLLVPDLSGRLAPRAVKA